MKKFNLLVVVGWFFVFFLSLEPNLDLVTSVREQTNYWFMWNMDWATTPDQPYVAKTDGGKYEFHMDATEIPYGDPQITKVILTNTAIPLFLLMLAFNIAFYAGNGTLGRWRKNSVGFVSIKLKKIWGHMTEKQRSKTPRVPTSAFDFNGE